MSGNGLHCKHLILSSGIETSSYRTRTTCVISNLQHLEYEYFSLGFAYVFENRDTIECLLFNLFLSHSVGQGKVSHVASYSWCSGGVCTIFEYEKME